MVVAVLCRTRDGRRDGRGNRRPGERWGCRSIPLRHGQSRSYTTNPSLSLSFSLSPSLSPSRSLLHNPVTPARLASTLVSWYVRTIANGLQPLPGIYPRNLPESDPLTLSSLLIQRVYPSGSLEGGIYWLRGSLNNETLFPRLRLNSRPEEGFSPPYDPSSFFQASWVARAWSAGSLSRPTCFLTPVSSSDAYVPPSLSRDFRTLTFLPPSIGEIDLS